MSEQSPIIDMLPGPARKVSYAVGALVGIGLSGTAVGFGAAGESLPTPLTVALAVYGFVAGPLFGLAARNVR